MFICKYYFNDGDDVHIGADIGANIGVDIDMTDAKHHNIRDVYTLNDYVRNQIITNK
jgi:hypothetical protein